MDHHERSPSGARRKQAVKGRDQVFRRRVEQARADVLEIPAQLARTGEGDSELVKVVLTHAGQEVEVVPSIFSSPRVSSFRLHSPWCPMAWPEGSVRGLPHETPTV
jgi:hypothetical protein